MILEIVFSYDNGSSEEKEVPIEKCLGANCSNSEEVLQ